jgi:hypothetical protein
LFFRKIPFAALILTVFSAGALAQAEPTPKETPKEPEVKIDLTKEQTDGRQVAESSIIVYSGLRGREGLDQIRKTAVEIGKITFTGPNGKPRKADYTKRVVRGTNFGDEKVRFDQKFPDAEYALIFDGGKVFGVISNTVFTPRDDAESSFRNEIVHGVGALLRYKENGSDVELLKSEKVMGVDYYVVELTDKENRKTTYYISKKTFRVLMLEYEDGGVKYQRKFYDHNYAQGTLVPYRTVLKADGKQIEESTIATITFGQVVEDSFFAFATP